VSVFDQNTTLLEDPVLTDGLLSLNFSSDLYYNNDQTEVSSTMLKQLVMTLTEVDEVEMVSVSIDGNIKVMDDTSRSIAVPTARTNVESFIEAH
jgi:germination protein M